MARLEQKDPDARIQHPERIYPSNEDIIAIEDIKIAAILGMYDRLYFAFKRRNHSIRFVQRNRRRRRVEGTSRQVNYQRSSTFVSCPFLICIGFPCCGVYTHVPPSLRFLAMTRCPLPLRILLADGHVGKSPAPATAFSAALITDFTPEQT